MVKGISGGDPAKITTPFPNTQVSPQKKTPPTERELTKVASNVLGLKDTSSTTPKSTTVQRNKISPSQGKPPTISPEQTAKQTKKNIREKYKSHIKAHSDRMLEKTELPESRRSVLQEMQKEPEQIILDLPRCGGLEIRGKKKYSREELGTYNNKNRDYRLYEGVREKLCYAIADKVSGKYLEGLNETIDEILYLGQQKYLFNAQNESEQLKQKIEDEYDPYVPLSEDPEGRQSLTYKVENPLFSGNPKVVITKKLKKIWTPGSQYEDARRERVVERVEMNASYDLITKEIKFEGGCSFGNSGWHKVIGEG